MITEFRFIPEKESSAEISTSISIHVTAPYQGAIIIVFEIVFDPPVPSAVNTTV